MPAVCLALSLVTEKPARERLAFAVSTPLSLLYLVAFTLNLQVW